MLVSTSLHFPVSVSTGRQYVGSRKRHQMGASDVRDLDNFYKCHCPHACIRYWDSKPLTETMLQVFVLVTGILGPEI